MAAAADTRKKDHSYTNCCIRKLCGPTLHPSFERGPRGITTCKERDSDSIQTTGFYIGEAKRYHCSVCNVSCRDNASLTRHKRTPRHLEKMVTIAGIARRRRRGKGHLWMNSSKGILLVRFGYGVMYLVRLVCGVYASFHGFPCEFSINVLKYSVQDEHLPWINSRSISILLSTGCCMVSTLSCQPS